MTDALPETMTCVEITEPGGPEVLVPATRPLPEPGAGEVLVQVAAAGINGPDIYQRKGLYPPRPGESDLPGLEISGTVVALGAGAEGPSVGDEVCALVGGGGYAEFCVAPDAQCLPVPKGIRLIDAGGLPETFFTVWTNLFERAALCEGETLLVHGGGGGIGTTAIQMARALGVRVMTTEASDEKCQACVSLGAERAVNFNSEDFVEAAKEFTEGKGVDVILDVVGGDYVDRNIKSLARDGRLVNIAFLKGPKVEVNLMPVMLKCLTLTGSTLRIQPKARKAQIAAGLRKNIWPLIEAGDIKPVIHTTLPLAEAAEGHRLMEGGQHIGKILLVA